jgi:hypothetical protein
MGLCGPAWVVCVGECLMRSSPLGSLEPELCRRRLSHGWAGIPSLSQQMWLGSWFCPGRGSGKDLREQLLRQNSNRKIKKASLSPGPQDLSKVPWAAQKGPQFRCSG